MTKSYVAVTYDVCEHDDLCEAMNEYILGSSVDMDKQVKGFAEQDVAPLVKVYESNTSNLGVLTLYKKYKFKKYECHCK